MEVLQQLDGIWDPVTDGMRVLEVATGSGEMFRRLVRANQGGSTLGVDLSPNMAWRTHHRVQREFPSSQTQCHAVDARHMPFRDATFDAVFCCYLLELLSGEDIQRTIGEIESDVVRGLDAPKGFGKAAYSQHD